MLNCISLSNYNRDSMPTLLKVYKDQGYDRRRTLPVNLCLGASSGNKENASLSSTRQAQVQHFVTAVIGDISVFLTAAASFLPCIVFLMEFQAVF